MSPKQFKKLNGGIREKVFAIIHNHVFRNKPCSSDLSDLVFFSQAQISDFFFFLIPITYFLKNHHWNSLLDPIGLILSLRGSPPLLYKQLISPTYLI